MEDESAAFVAGERDNTVFTPFRLRQGVYGQRQADVQMIRVKIPAEFSLRKVWKGWASWPRSSPRWARATSPPGRMSSFHHIPLDECPEVLRLLGTAGLSTREACGNTVRNVVGAPTAGVCERRSSTRRRTWRLTSVSVCAIPSPRVSRASSRRPSPGATLMTTFRPRSRT